MLKLDITIYHCQHALTSCPYTTVALSLCWQKNVRPSRAFTGDLLIIHYRERIAWCSCSGGGRHSVTVPTWTPCAKV